ncbi:unnamed protein product [Schistosoma margrebowiei]|uniref:Uncharacterized protein n=1 Tax=Schistosoma margrebowiei TaxID=48269 RepID=A0A183MWL1_9TREM|nr:unnamed protein product [Schistosoma margrebowiei]
MVRTRLSVDSNQLFTALWILSHIHKLLAEMKQEQHTGKPPNEKLKVHKTGGFTSNVAPMNEVNAIGPQKQMKKNNSNKPPVNAFLLVSRFCPLGVG